MCACGGDMWAAKLTMKERARRRTKEGGETALTNNPYKANIKAREAQNHNKYGKATPKHLSSLVKHIFLHLLL